MLNNTMRNTFGQSVLLIFGLLASTANGVALEGSISEFKSLLSEYNHAGRPNCNCEETSAVPDSIIVTPSSIETVPPALTIFPTVETAYPALTVVQPTDIVVVPDSITTQPPDVTAYPPSILVTPTVTTIYPDLITLCICGGHGHGSHDEKTDVAAAEFGVDNGGCTNTIITPSSIEVTPDVVTGYPTPEVVIVPMITVFPDPTTVIPEPINVQPTPELVTPASIETTPPTLTVHPTEETVFPTPVTYTTCSEDNLEKTVYSAGSAAYV